MLAFFFLLALIIPFLVLFLFRLLPAPSFIVVASGQCRRSGALPMLLGTDDPSC